MPRRNNTQPHQPFHFVNHEASKTRFRSQQAAQKAANRQMLITFNLKLYVYQSPFDGGWYITRKAPTDRQA
ncbi:MAG: hypothetical protein WAS27_03920 [Candidatus Saccharimonadales bacterium]